MHPAFNTKRRAVAAVAIASALSLVGALPAGATAGDQTTGATWDTYSAWDGSSFGSFGRGNGANTLGQWFTAPAGKTKLKKFQFWVARDSGTGTMKFRGELYTWDGSKAVTPIWESETQSHDVTRHDPTYHGVTMRLGNHGLITPGQTYVMFVSVSKDYEENPPRVRSRWAFNYSDVLPNSDLVWLNDGGDESQWTTPTWGWSVFTGKDFALKAWFA